MGSTEIGTEIGTEIARDCSGDGCQHGWEVDHNRDRGVLPSGIADMPPGPELARVLAGVDRTTLNGHELVILLGARHRLVASMQAEEMADTAELAHCPPCYPDSPPERAGIDNHAPDVMRAALKMTRRAANMFVALALDLRERLPEVWAALRTGEIDLARARVISDGTGHIADDHRARRVVEGILPVAGDLTTGQIGARLRHLCLTTDPEDAKDRYEESVENRHVYSLADPDGTGNLYAVGLPPERLNSAMERLERLARAVDGEDPRSMDQRRADILLDLLEGTHSSAPARDKKGTVDIRVDLTTLAGLEENAAEIPGWGPVIADIARQVARRRTRWQVTVTDPDTSEPLDAFPTGRRPTAEQRRQVEARDLTCVFPGCRMPATQADLDHTVDHAAGGPTEPANLAPLCRHDHLLKHGDWRLHRPAPGVFEWTSPHHHTYLTESAHPP